MLNCNLSFFCLLIFFKINVFKNDFKNTTRVSNGLNPDQDRRYVGPDPGPNCLLRLSEAASKERVTLMNNH